MYLLFVRKQTLSTLLLWAAYWIHVAGTPFWFCHFNPSTESQLGQTYHGDPPAIINVIIFVSLYLQGIFHFHKNTRLRARKPTTPEQSPSF